MSLEQNISAGRNDRRSFLKLMAAAPLFATIGSRSLANTVAAVTKKPVTGNIYSRLGVRSFINARGTWTYLSGSLELPDVRKAMEEASHHFVDMFELQVAAGRYLAKLSALSRAWLLPAQLELSQWQRRGVSRAAIPRMYGSCRTQLD